MAGKHREESSNTVVKIAGVTGIAVAASLLSAGTAAASPFGFGGFGHGSSSSSSKSVATTPKPSFFTNPVTVGTTGKYLNGTATPTPGGQVIVKTNPAPSSGIPYVTAPGSTQIIGFCLNPNGC